MCLNPGGGGGGVLFMKTVATDPKLRCLVFVVMLEERKNGIVKAIALHVMAFTQIFSV